MKEWNYQTIIDVSYLTAAQKWYYRMGYRIPEEETEKQVKKRIIERTE